MVKESEKALASRLEKAAISSAKTMSDAAGGAGLAYTTKTSILASNWPKDGSVIDRIDKRLSAPIFRLQLGIVLEWILSVPGCFFGMPAALLVSPALIACGVGGCSSAPPHAIGLLAAATAAILVVWIRFNNSTLQDGPPLVLFRPTAVVVAPALGTALAHLVADAGVPLAAGSFHLTAWYLGIIPVLLLKQSTRRRRPVACEPQHIGAKAIAAAPAKRLANIPAKLRRADPNAAFPSGDVGGAMSVAYVLLKCGGGAATAVGCVLLSAFGRMYWQAHHALDVFVGAVVSLLTCLALDAIVRANEGTPPSSNYSSHAVVSCPRAAWWHPLLALGVLAVQQRLQRRMQKLPGRSAAAAKSKES